MNMFYQLRAANKVRKHEWDPEGKITPEYLGNALAGEVGEACNVVKKLARKRLGLRGSEGSVGALGQELADVIIYADLLAAEFNIDLGFKIREKFNATSDKYGLKTKLG